MVQEGTPWRRKYVEEYFFIPSETGVIRDALEHALGDCYFSDEDAAIAGELLKGLQD